MFLLLENAEPGVVQKGTTCKNNACKGVSEIKYMFFFIILYIYLCLSNQVEKVQQR